MRVPLRILADVRPEAVGRQPQVIVAQVVAGVDRVIGQRESLPAPSTSRAAVAAACSARSE